MRSKFALVIIGILFLLAFFSIGFGKNGTWKENAGIKWDMSGYYMYLPAVFIYDQLTTGEFMSQIDETYHPSDDRKKYGQVPVEDGRVVMKFTGGMAVSYLPFFAVAHTITPFTKYPADGYSKPYQMFITLSGLVYAFLGLLVLRKLLRNFFPDDVVAWVLLGIGLGTNLFIYATKEAAMSHGILFLLHAIILYLSFKWHQHPSTKRALLLGACLGFTALIRPSEVIVSVVPLLWGLKSFGEIPGRVKWLWQRAGNVALIFGVAFCIGFTQLVYWKVLTGHFIFDSYVGEGNFTFLSPHIIDGLFSYKKGWFVYSPLMFFAMLGLLLLKRYVPAALVVTLVYVLLNLYLVFSWNPWWYGGSFGMRALIQMSAIVSFGLASLLAYLFQRTLTKELAMLLIGGFIILNFYQSAQYRHGIMHWEEMTKEKYWEIFLK